MFNRISILTYGRCSKHKSDWNLACRSINRIYFVHSGTVVHGIKNPHTLVPGRLYLFTQNQEFELLPEENTLVDHTFIDFTTIPPINLNSIYENTLSDSSLIQHTAFSLINLIDNFPMHPNNFTRPQSYNTVRSYLKCLLECINDECQLLTHADPVISKCLEYIHTNFSANISIKELAAEINYEESVFIRHFKKVMGVTPYKYIKNYRLATALNLLNSNSLSISEIAEIVGYSNIASFSHAFKHVYGVYPSNTRTID